MTCLIDAVTNGHKDVVKMLVEKGADLRIKDAHVSLRKDGGWAERWECEERR